MNERQSLLQTVLDNLDDDMPRLVFADWLEEHVESERAELIRVQIRISEINEEVQSDEDCDSPGCSCCVERRPLRKREQELLSKHLDWSDDLASALDLEGFTKHNGTSHGWGETSWEYYRGFVEKIVCSSADWFAHHAEILESHPIREVRLTDLPMMDQDADGKWRPAGQGSPATAVMHPSGFSQIWPTITFHLPVDWPRITFNLPEYSPLIPGTAFREAFDEANDRIIQSMGIPASSLGATGDANYSGRSIPMTVFRRSIGLPDPD